VVQLAKRQRPRVRTRFISHVPPPDRAPPTADNDPGPAARPHANHRSQPRPRETPAAAATSLRLAPAFKIRCIMIGCHRDHQAQPRHPAPARRDGAGGSLRRPPSISRSVQQRRCRFPLYRIKTPRKRGAPARFGAALWPAFRAVLARPARRTFRRTRNHGRSPLAVATIAVSGWPPSRAGRSPAAPLHGLPPRSMATESPTSGNHPPRSRHGVARA
jgi:hypothetical protein